MSKLLHSVITGKGKPLIILHGYMGMGDNWRSLALEFSKHYEVHQIDQRNHGRSFHTYAFDYELLVEDLHHYISEKNLKTVYLLGHSMGGKVAMLFAVTYPELVDKVIVADISPKEYEPHHQQILAALNEVNFDLHDTRKKIDDVLKIYIKHKGIRQFLMKNVYRKGKNEYAYRFNLTSLTENNSEVGKALPSFKQYNKPVLFLKGETSDYILDEDKPLIKAHFENAQIKIISNAGHWLHAENPEQFYNESIEFLK
ncbi:MAG TPA: alpha/beta fold hydrolase [Flavobacteriaceae bacterium]|nr:alpha/beta fold hydrolase [Flavobacteriaceae bacterium]